MFRLFSILSAFCVCLMIGTSASAQSITNEQLANEATFNAIAQAYGTGLNHRRDSRLEPEINVQQIRDTLAHLDGVALIETKTTKISWNARLGHAEIWLNEEQMPATWSRDSLGRLTFNTKLALGWIDVSGDFLFVDFSVRGPRQLSISVIPGPDRQTGTPVVCGVKVCVCANGGGGCGEDDCYNGQTCTGSSASCIYKDPPPAPPPSNGGCGCPIAVIGLATGLPLSLFSRSWRQRRRH